MDLSTPDRLLLAVAVVLLTALVCWELRAASPFIDIRMLVAGTGRSTSATALLLVPSFMVGAITPALGSACLICLTAATPLWALAGVSVLFGVSNGLNVVGNQTAMYEQAPGAQIGTAAGLLRTFMYLGAILSASLISITFGQRATDTGLHGLAVILTCASVPLVVGIVLGIRRRRR